MKALLLLASFVLAVSAVSYEDIILKEWELYKAQFGKSYDTPAEDYYRMTVFRESKYMVAVHNIKYKRGEESYGMAINEFSDMLAEEVDRIYNGFNLENRLRAKAGEDPVLPELDGEEFVLPENFQVPDAINWVEKGAVTQVRHQGKCGSCYAFAAVAALEGRLYLKSKKLVNLSQQNIVDCSGAYGNKGCNGGLASNSYNYIKANKGINDYNTYPYEGKAGKCRYNSTKIAGTCSGYTQIAMGNEELLKQAVAMGPVAVSIDSSLKSFQTFGEGVYSDPNCSSTKLGHAVVVVGYGNDPKTKKDYWLIKNSWGTEWGVKGYIKMARNAKNMCGVATRAVFPKV